MAEKMRIIKFQEMFEPTIKTKVKCFLESGKKSATLSKALIVTAFLGGSIFVGAICPNLFSVFGKFSSGYKSRITKDGFYKLRKNFYQLRKSRIIELIKKKDGEEIYALSVKGKIILKKILFDNLIISAPKKWDKKWRLIIFDIPHNKKIARDALRRKLRGLGCFLLQKSVWVYPFPCEEEIYFIAKNFNIYQNNIEVFTVDDFNNIRALNFFKEIIESYL